MSQVAESSGSKESRVGGAYQAYIPPHLSSQQTVERRENSSSECIQLWTAKSLENPLVNAFLEKHSTTGQLEQVNAA